MAEIVYGGRQIAARALTPKERFLLLFLLALFCLTGVFDHTLWPPNDSREGAMIAEMSRTGDWLTPAINGEPYLEKPPLLHWTGALFCKIAGRVNEGLVRLPAAIYGFGAIFIAYLFACQLGYERAGIAGAFMCATSIMYMEYSRIVLTDVCIAFVAMLSLWLFWQAYTRKQAFWWVIFLFSSALSFYAKGLLGPGFIWVTIMAYLLYRREWKLVWILPALFVPVFILCVGPWVWALYKKGGIEYLNTAFVANQIGRFFTFSDKTLPPDPYFCNKEPFYYYFKMLPVYLLPWSLLMIAALVHWFKKGRGLSDPLSVFLRFAVVSMSAILCLSAAKDTRYAIPLFPILFLMTGVWIAQKTESSFAAWEKWAIRLTGILTALLLFLIPMLVIGLYAAPQAIYDHFTKGVDILKAPGTFYARFAFAACVLVLILEAASVFKFRKFSSSERLNNLLLYPALYAAFLIPLEAVVMPAYDHQRTLLPCADIAREEIPGNARIALGFDEGCYIGVFTFYLDRRFPVLVSPREAADFLSNPNLPSAVIIKSEDTEKIEKLIMGDRARVVKSRHTGLNGGSFRILANFPEPRPKEHAHE